MKLYRMRNFLLLILILSVLVFSYGCGGQTTPTSQQTPDGIRFRFAAFGDNQIGYTAWISTRATNPSSANIPQLRQTITDINNVPLHQTNLIFLLGDLVMNEVVDNGEALQIQLDAWQEVYSSLTYTGVIPLIPVAGNHELVSYYIAINNEAPNPGAIDVWVNWFAQNRYDTYAGNGPTPGGANLDKLVRDESKLTYSFNSSGVHFVVINTDTLNTETDPITNMVYQGWIPINWIEQDIEDAQNNADISTIIVMGHRPVEFPTGETYNERDIILNSQTYPFGTRLADVMRQNSKVKLYVACHDHKWDAFRLQGGACVWQITTGNGGAPLDSDWNPPTGINYGYTLFDIYSSGKIVIQNYGRALPPSPQKFYEDTPVAPLPATLRETIEI